MDNTSDAQFDQKVRNVVISQVQLLIAVVAFLVPMLGFFFKIQLDVALIKQNHESHMEQALEAIKVLNEQQATMLQKLNEEHDQIIILEQQHNQFQAHIDTSK